MLAAVMMLQHLGLPDKATEVHNAWLRTIEDGIMTNDLSRGGPSVGTREFAEAVAQRLGRLPERLKPVEYAGAPSQESTKYQRKPIVADKQLVGCDVFLDSRQPTEEIGASLEQLAGPDFQLKMITNRGAKVYPGGLPETFCTDHWRCRFVAAGSEGKLSHALIRELLGRLEAAGWEWIKLEGLYTFDGKRAYSLGQGE
jgi:isocitrate dehydrogenase